MKINSVNNVAFCRVLTPREKEEANTIREKAMELLGNKRVIIIVPEQSMPVDSKGNIGIGQLNSKTTFDFIETMKTYTGLNTLKILPQGELNTPPTGLYCNYSSSGLTLGSYTINLEELTTEEMGNILSKKTLKNVYDKSKETGTTGIANFENVIGKESMQMTALKEAFENFQTSTNPVISEMKKDFEKYKLENSFLDRRAYYEILSDVHGTPDFYAWTNEIDKNLFDKKLISNEVRNKRISEIKGKHNKDIDFLYFRQYLADMNLKKAKSNINSMNVEVMGDCLIGFSYDSIWAYPNAFEKANIADSEWGIRALKYTDIIKEGTESNKLFRLKIEQFAKRYDQIRFDVGWSYIDPILYPLEGQASTLEGRYYFDKEINGYRIKKPLNDDIIKLIEDTVKSIKGDDYNLDKLIYETEAGPKEFSPFNYDKSKIKNALKNRTIIQSSCYMSDDYATIDFLESKMGVQRKNYIHMPGNHDHIALNALARKIDNDGMLKANGNNIEEVFANQIRPLAKGLNISETEIRNNPKKFAKSKFSYSFLAENVKLFFMDIFGRTEQFDSQSKNSAKNYRQMIAYNYETKLQEAIQNDKGLNIMETLAMAMKGKNLDKTNSDVYNDLLKFSNILKEKEIPKITEPLGPVGPKGKPKSNNKIAYFYYGIFTLGLILTGVTLLLKKYFQTKISTK